MIGTVQYREGNKTFPGLRWCIVRSNGEVYPLHRDENTHENGRSVQFVLKSDRYGIGPYAFIVRELSKEDYREEVLNQILR